MAAKRSTGCPRRRGTSSWSPTAEWQLPMPRSAAASITLSTERWQLQELSKAWVHGSHIAASAATLVLLAPDVKEPGVRESIQFDLGQVSMPELVDGRDHAFLTLMGEVELDSLDEFLSSEPPGFACGWR